RAQVIGISVKARIIEGARRNACGEQQRRKQQDRDKPGDHSAPPLDQARNGERCDQRDADEDKWRVKCLARKTARRQQEGEKDVYGGDRGIEIFCHAGQPSGSPLTHHRIFPSKKPESAQLSLSKSEMMTASIPSARSRRSHTISEELMISD